MSVGRSREVRGDPGRSGEIRGDPGRSREIQRYPERSREIQRDPGRSREIQGGVGEGESAPAAPPRLLQPRGVVHDAFLHQTDKLETLAIGACEQSTV